jgi:hypothetical protein
VEATAATVEATATVKTAAATAMPAASMLREYRHGEEGEQNDNDRLE